MFNKKNLLFSILLMILVIPPFIWGGKDVTASAIVFILTFPLIYFLFSSELDLSIGGKLFFKIKSLLKNPLVPLAIFSFLIFLSYFYSFSPTETFNSIFGWIFYFLLFFSIFYFIENYRDIEKFSKIIICLGAILSLIGIYFFLISELYHYLRLFSTFYHHNAFAAFLLIPFFLSLSYNLTDFNKKKLGFFAIINILLAIALFFTYSRGGWLSFLIVLPFLIFSLRKQIAKINIVYFVLSFILAIAIIFGIGQIKEKQASQNFVEQNLGGQAAEYLEKANQEKSKTKYLIETSEENALLARLAYWRGAYEIFKNNPIFGVGWESYKTLYLKYLKDVRYFSVDPHNFYLKVLVELGAVGFFFWLWFVGLIIYFIFKILPLAIFKKDFAVVGIGAGLIAMLINISGELSFQFSANAIMFFFSSAIIAKYYLTSTNYEAGLS